MLLPDSKTVLFVDDIVLYRTIVSPADYSTLQSDINSIADWIESNHLSLHTGKCFPGSAHFVLLLIMH